VDTVVVALAGLAALDAHLAAGHGGPLASERVRPLLDLEVPPSSGKTACGLSDWRLDSTNVPSQLLVGSTPHSRGNTQAGNRGSPVNGGQTSAPTAEAAFVDLGDLPEEPHEADGLDGLLHGADGNLAGAVRLLSCYRTTVGASCTSALRNTQPKTGPHSRFEKRFRGTKYRGT